MVFRRKGTQLVYNVTNPELIPLYEGNDAYEVVVKNEAVAEEKVETPKKTTRKK